MDKTYILKLRRFALTIGLVLLTYSLASIELNIQKEISPLGLPLNVKNPNLIGIALMFASIYAFFRYLYYAILIGPPPHTMQKRLSNGILPDGTHFNVSISDTGYYHTFHGKLEAAINEIFPRIGSVEAKLIKFNITGTEAEIKIEVPKLVKVFCFLENIDYYSPAWINVAAWVIFIIKSINRTMT